MSAIAGVYFPDGRPVDRSVLDCMGQKLAHRGPDGAGSWKEGPVGLVSRLLWSTPQSRHERFPLEDAPAGLVLTADARIDNRDELEEALGLGGDSARTDGQLILEAYKKWGEHCPERLLGDFAFAVWDTRRRVLFCARDHLGVKPFFYHHRQGSLFVFGSEIKALFCLDGVPRRLNEIRVGDYLVPILEDKEITFYEDIQRLPPAHSLTVSREGISRRCYWSLDPARKVRLGSDAEYAAAYRDLFTEAVRCRLRGGFSAGSMLSGGLDSSSIACVARNLLKEDGQERLHTFSAVFDEVHECDEREYIEAVLDQGDVEPHFVHADQIGPLTDLDRMFRHHDEAFYAPNMFMHWALFKEARKHGVRVLLDGLDGDTTVSHAIPFVCELLWKGRWLRLAAEVRGIARNFNSKATRVLWRRGLKPLIPESLSSLKRKLRGQADTLRTPIPMIRKEFAERIGLLDRERDLLWEKMRPPRTALQDHYRRLTSGIVPLVLEVTDRAAAAFGIEPRYPFFDRRLVEFCLAVPPEQKIRRGWTRYIMREALVGIMPEKVCWRRGKSDLSSNFRLGLLRHGRESLDAVILGDPHEIEPYVDLEALRRTYLRYKKRLDNDDSLAVWKPVTLALWLRRAGFA